MTAAAAFLAGSAVLSAALALATWGDGDPGPWIWISFVCAPLGLVAGVAAWFRGRRQAALAALVVSAVVSAFWLLLTISLVRSGL